MRELDPARARAVVVMGKLPRPGRVKTRLARDLSPALAAELYRAFLLDTFALVDRAARAAVGEGGAGFVRVFAVALADDEALGDAAELAPAGWRTIAQRGADLGARMAAAREDAGAEAAVIVGSDAPDLPGARITEALDALAASPAGERRVVLGPTADGGYYLIGSAGAVPELMRAMPWSTPAVLGETRARAAAAGIRVVELAPWADVDELADLERLRASLAGEPSPAVAAETRAALAALGVRLASKGRAD